MGSIVSLFTGKEPDRPDPPPDPAIAERERRLAQIERARRGRAGTIRTSDAGLLGARSDRSPFDERRSLLGG